MKRGDIAIVAMSGDCGKTRPALVVQHDQANETHASVVMVQLNRTLALWLGL
jgi:mRNA interferase MazF